MYVTGYICIYITMANAQVNVRYLPNIRGGRFAYFGGHKFKVNRQVDDTCYWTCTTSRCKGSIHTRDDRLLKIGSGHNHPAPPYIFDIDTFKTLLLDRARTEITLIPTIYDDEVTALRRMPGLPLNALQYIPVLASVRTPMYRQRQKTRPLLSRTRQAVQLDGEWRLTDAGDDFLIADHGAENRILIFTTRVWSREPNSHLHNQRELGTFVRC